MPYNIYTYTDTQTDTHAHRHTHIYIYIYYTRAQRTHFLSRCVECGNSNTINKTIKQQQTTDRRGYSIPSGVLYSTKIRFFVFRKKIKDRTNKQEKTRREREREAFFFCLMLLTVSYEARGAPNPFLNTKYKLYYLLRTTQKISIRIWYVGAGGRGQ